MKTIILSVITVLVILAFACQNKLTEEKEYITNVSGTLTYKGEGRVVPVTAGVFDTTSDINGKYSLTVIHDGSFLFKAGSLINYTETIVTKSGSLTRNVAR